VLWGALDRHFEGTLRYDDGVTPERAVSAQWYETVLGFERRSTAALEIVLAHPSGRVLSVNRGLRAPVAEYFELSSFHGCVVLTRDLVTASE
jgi:hypothetical protein